MSVRRGQSERSGKPARHFQTPRSALEPWSIEPLADIQFHGSGDWTITGDQAQLSLKPPDPPIRAGVYEMRIECSGHMDASLTLKVRADRGAGFDDVATVRLPSGAGARNVLIVIKRNTKAIRIEPAAEAERVNLVAILMRRLGALRFAARLRRQTAHWPAAFARLIAGDPAAALKIADQHPRESYMTAYEAWLARYEPSEASIAPRIRAYIAAMSRHPVISIVMPAYNSDPDWLSQAVESVRRQTYENWELCIADDASPDPGVWAFLSGLPAMDARIKVVQRPTNGGIAEATNLALGLASGEWIAFMDHDDLIRHDALALIADAVVRNDSARIIYTDEDKIDENGKRSEPYMKGGWNRELFYGQNFLNHFTAIRRDVIDAVGPLRAELDGSQDYDLLLRCIEQVGDGAIVHLPFVIYHWRFATQRVNFSMQAGNRSFDNSLRALNEHFARTGQPAKAERACQDLLYARAKWRLEKSPLVSLIIPTRDRMDMLQTAIRSIREKTTYSHYEILIADNDSREKTTLDYFRELERSGAARIIPTPGPFNFSRINNLAAEEAKGEILGFINNDIEVWNGNWLDEMVSHFARKDIGAVGAKLYYPDGRIQHAGVVTGIGGVAGHIYKLLPGNTPGPFSLLALPRETTCATAACLLTRASLFRQLDGFDETNLAVAFNDVDLCLKIRRAGARIVWTPFAELTHYESVSRGADGDPAKSKRFESEVRHMWARWSHEVLDTDPYYSPNLTLGSEDASLARPPRVSRPWT